MSKFYAVGDKVILNKKRYKHDELLPKRPPGYYNLLVGNGIAREEKVKEVFKSSAEGGLFADEETKEAIKDFLVEHEVSGKEKAKAAQAQPEEWGEKPVSVNTKIKSRGKK